LSSLDLAEGHFRSRAWRGFSRQPTPSSIDTGAFVNAT
jgi:hypothetical protein